MTSTIRTTYLEIAYEEWGNEDGTPVVLVHGWPDDVHSWDRIVPELATAGYRVLAPHLRGHGRTRFLAQDTPRSGQISALGHDLAEFIDRLELDDVVLVGHDWGCRASYVVAALYPGRLRGLVAMSAPYPRADPNQPIPYDLAKSYWYEWFCAIERGRQAFDIDRKSISNYLWRSWSPSWDFEQADFDVAAQAWQNPDWPAVTVHAYLHRWNEAPGAPAYEDLEERLAKHPPIDVPTIVLHGAEDRGNLPPTTAGKEEYFTGPYRRILLPGIGHFVPREDPTAATNAISAMIDATQLQA